LGNRPRNPAKEALMTGAEIGCGDGALLRGAGRPRWLSAAAVGCLLAAALWAAAPASAASERFTVTNLGPDHSLRFEGVEETTWRMGFEGRPEDGAVLGTALHGWQHALREWYADQSAAIPIGRIIPSLKFELKSPWYAAILRFKVLDKRDAETKYGVDYEIWTGGFGERHTACRITDPDHPSPAFRSEDNIAPLHVGCGGGFGQPLFGAAQLRDDYVFLINQLRPPPFPDSLRRMRERRGSQ
jgi:hypothetical protein